MNNTILIAVVVAAVAMIMTNTAASAEDGSLQSSALAASPEVEDLDKTGTTRGKENTGGSQALYFKRFASPLSFGQVNHKFSFYPPDS